MPQTIHGATNALITALKGIKGTTSGHINNFRGRVFNRLVLPDDEGVGLSDKYICLPGMETNPIYEWEDFHVEIRWTQPVWIFIQELSTKVEVSKSYDLCLKAWSDVLEVIQNDRELGGAVKDVRLGSGGDLLAGVDSDDPWSEVHLVAELFIMHDAKSLT